MDINSIKSIQIIDNYFPVIDGVIETVHNYALNMNSVVVCPSMTKKYNTDNLPYEVLTCPAFHVPLSQYAVALPALDHDLLKSFEKINPDILHIHSPALLGKHALEMGHKLGIPVVATFHSKIYDAVLEYSKNKEIAKLVTDNTVRFYEKCDAVWACSAGTADTLRSYGFNGPITVMTNGTSLCMPTNPDIIKNQIITDFGIPTNKHILLFVGQMVWYKNIRLILDTFKLLCNTCDDYCMVFAGIGKDEEAIKNYAQKLEIPQDNIKYLGKISDRELLAGLYLCADLFFFPSVYDNTPLVVREAAALGIPSLLTIGSNAAESIIKDVNGFTAVDNAEDMSNEIIRIFNNQALLNKVGERAKDSIPIKWTSLIPRVESEYLKIISGYKEN